MKVLEYLLANILYGIYCLLRWLVLSSTAGARIHGFVLYYVVKLLYPGSEDLKIGILQEMLKGNPAVIEWARRGYSIESHVRRRIMKNALVWMHGIGRLRQMRLKNKGLVVPSYVFISPTYRCNLDCQSCYAKGRQGELSLEMADRILREQEQLGIFSVILTGGEPFLWPHLWSIAKIYHRTSFTVFTNGTLIGEREINRIVELGNIRLMVSVEGFRENTDRKRGKGIYDKLIKCLRRCQRANIAYGVTVTVTKDNLYEVTTKEFVELMVALGVLVINYLTYLPLGPEADSSLMISPNQMAKLEKWVSNIRKSYPILSIIGRGGSSFVEQCEAGKISIHITANGDIEPCMFSQWSTDNIQDKSLLEAMQSDFLRLIRGFNQTGENCLIPCKVCQSLFLQKAFQTVGASSTNNTGKEERDAKAGTKDRCKNSGGISRAEQQKD